MRQIIDSRVRKYYQDKVFEQDTYRELMSTYPGEVCVVNDIDFVPYSKVPKSELFSEISQTVESGESIKSAVLSYVPTTSAYQSVAAQYWIYKSCTTEVKPRTLAEFLSDYPNKEYTDCFDIDVLQKLVNLIDAQNTFSDKKQKTADASGNDLLSIASSI